MSSGVPRWRCRTCGNSSRSLLDNTCTRCREIAQRPPLYFKTHGPVFEYGGGDDLWWCSLGEHEVEIAYRVPLPTGAVWMCEPCVEAIRRSQHVFRIGREEEEEEVRRG
jgi:hypothetical protein